MVHADVINTVITLLIVADDIISTELNVRIATIKDEH